MGYYFEKCPKCDEIIDGAPEYCPACGCKLGKRINIPIYESDEDGVHSDNSNDKSDSSAVSVDDIKTKNGG